MVILIFIWQKNKNAQFILKAKLQSKFKTMSTDRVIDWVEVAWPSQPIKVMSSQSVYPITLFLGKISPLSC